VGDHAVDVVLDRLHHLLELVEVSLVALRREGVGAVAGVPVELAVCLPLPVPSLSNRAVNLARVTTDGFAAMLDSSRATDTALSSRLVWRRTAIA
jgi:hypothetical protein